MKCRAVAAAAASSFPPFLLNVLPYGFSVDLALFIGGKKSCLLYCSVVPVVVYSEVDIFESLGQGFTFLFGIKASQPSPSHPFTPSFLLSQSGVYMIWRCASVSVRIQLVSFHFFLWGVVIWGLNPTPEVLPGTPSLSWALASSFVLFVLPVIWNVWHFRLLFASPGTSSHL